MASWSAWTTSSETVIPSAGMQAHQVAGSSGSSSSPALHSKKATPVRSSASTRARPSSTRSCQKIDSSVPMVEHIHSWAAGRVIMAGRKAWISRSSRWAQASSTIPRSRVVPWPDDSPLAVMATVELVGVQMVRSMPMARRISNSSARRELRSRSTCSSHFSRDESRSWAV